MLSHFCEEAVSTNHLKFAGYGAKNIQNCWSDMKLKHIY